MAVLDGDHSEARGIFDRLTPGERVAFEHVLDDLSNLMADAIEAGNG